MTSKNEQPEYPLLSSPLAQRMSPQAISATFGRWVKAAAILAFWLTVAGATIGATVLTFTAVLRAVQLGLKALAG